MDSGVYCRSGSSSRQLRRQRTGRRHRTASPAAPSKHLSAAAANQHAASAPSKHLSASAANDQSVRRHAAECPSLAWCRRAVYAASLWQSGIVHDAIAAAAYLKFHPATASEQQSATCHSRTQPQPHPHPQAQAAAGADDRFVELYTLICCFV